MEFNPEIREERGSKLREQFNFFKNMVFLNFWLSFLVRGGILSQNSKMMSSLPIRNKWEITLQSPGKLSIFLGLALFSTFLSSGTFIPVKALFLKLTEVDFSGHKV